MKKLLCIMLAVLMLAACFVACGDKADDSSKGNSKDPATSGEASAESKNDDSTDVDESKDDTIYRDLLPEAVDMEGYTFDILERWFGYGKTTIDFQGEVIWIDSEEDEQMSNLNIAKKKVLDEVQAKYNCKIQGDISTDSVADIRTAVTEDIISRTKAYDFCFEAPYYYSSLVEEGNLVNLKTLGIDFSKAWWDQNAVSDLSICDELYFALGDINTYDNDGTFVCFFNKTLLAEKFGDEAVEELYTLAANGEWTFDKMKEYVTGFGEDANGDSKRDEQDKYGLMTELDNIYLGLISSGGKVVTKNAQDEPEFALEDERAIDVLNSTIEFYNQSNDVLIANLPVYQTKFEGYDVHEKTVINGFKEGRGLFYICGLIHLSYLSEMENDFGILPVPKYDATQERYYHTMGTETSSALFVPDNGRDFSGKDGQYLAIILDALGAYSKDYLTPEYYDKQLKRKNAPDPDSAEMLDIVFESRTFDLGVMYSKQWGEVLDAINAIDVDIASSIAAKAFYITMNIETTIEKIRARQAG